MAHEIIVGRGTREIRCEQCRKVYDYPGEALLYKGKLFCDTSCLGEYLVDQIEEDIDDVWIDTEENIKMGAEEERNEW